MAVCLVYRVFHRLPVRRDKRECVIDLRVFKMRVGLFTKEFPSHVYGGAGVHVDYLSRELAKEITVEVYCWGRQNSDNANLHVHGAEP